MSPHFQIVPHYNYHRKVKTRRKKHQLGAYFDKHCSSKVSVCSKCLRAIAPWKFIATIIRGRNKERPSLPSLSHAVPRLCEASVAHWPRPTTRDTRQELLRTDTVRTVAPEFHLTKSVLLETLSAPKSCLVTSAPSFPRTAAPPVPGHRPTEGRVPSSLHPWNGPLVARSFLRCHLFFFYYF